jgi:hypothetical protein
LEKQDQGMVANLTLRQRRAAPHEPLRAIVSNADPIGFGLKISMPPGWRDREVGQGDDASGELPGGKRFQPERIKAIIAGSDDFSRNRGMTSGLPAQKAGRL